MPMPANLVLRSFVDPADDEACQILEQRANQFGGGNRGGLRARLAKALIEVFPGHPKGFAAKARLCDEHEIVVVADKDAGDKVIAVVVVTILSVTYHGAAIKAGWLFDLRVDEDYQRQGIGRALSEEAERRCLARGVSMIHLTCVPFVTVPVVLAARSLEAG
jgi:GNAT superfamily N-acetyltransferase